MPDGDRTRMLVAAQDPPWRAIRAFRNSQGQALVHLHNVSGGVLAGDSLCLSIDAEPSTRVQITSVGATRIYRRGPGRPMAHLRTSIRIGDGAMLEYLPDVVIPFAGSSFSQSTSVSLAHNAGFIGWETIAAGRTASGETFAFDFFHSECTVHSGSRPLALERYTLIPAERELHSIARWGRFRYTASLYMCHTGLAQSRWRDIESCLNELALLRTSPSVRWGVSRLIENGLVIRALALEAHHITSGLRTFWERGKQEIWCEPAVPPRKIN
jgi:urease accessory protein